MRVFSFGGGVQSMACLVLAAQSKLNYAHFLFANVGADSENPKTLDYFRDVALPYAKSNSIDLIELQKTKRGGEIETLLGRINSTARSIPIPARMSNGAPGHRSCTADFKIRVIARWQKKNGATVEHPAVTGLGISLDEFQRARTDSGIPWQTLEYPLLDMRIDRATCVKIIKSTGLPVPPKSSCYFCPYHSRSEWMRLKREQIECFLSAVEVEKTINAKRGLSPKDRVWLHSSLTPLETAVGNQMVLAEDVDICESGFCFV